MTRPPIHGTRRRDPGPPLRRAGDVRPAADASTTCPTPTWPSWACRSTPGCRTVPAPRFGPGHMRASSKLLRPYNPASVWSRSRPAGRRRRRRRGQPVRPRRGRRDDRGGVGRGPVRRRDTAHHRRRPHHRAAAAAVAARGTTARSPSCTSTRTWTPGTPTSARPTRTAHRSGGPVEEGLLDLERCLHMGTRGPLYSSRDLEDDHLLGFQVIRSDDYEIDGVASIVDRMRARLADAPGVRLHRHRRARPRPRARHRNTRGRRPDQPRTAQHPARPGRAQHRRRRHRRGVPAVRPRRDHRHRRRPRRLRTALGPGPKPTGHRCRSHASRIRPRPPITHRPQGGRHDTATTTRPPLRRPAGSSSSPAPSTTSRRRNGTARSGTRARSGSPATSC